MTIGADEFATCDLFHDPFIAPPASTETGDAVRLPTAWNMIEVETVWWMIQSTVYTCRMFKFVGTNHCRDLA